MTTSVSIPQPPPAPAPTFPAIYVSENGDVAFAWNERDGVKIGTTNPAPRRPPSSVPLGRTWIDQLSGPIELGCHSTVQWEHSAGWRRLSTSITITFNP